MAIKASKAGSAAIARKKPLIGYGARFKSAGDRRVFRHINGAVLVGRWFVVHRTEDFTFPMLPVWTVTHRTTGRKIGGGYCSRECAVEAALKLSRMPVMWGGSFRLINDRTTSRQRAALYRLTGQIERGLRP